MTIKLHVGYVGKTRDGKRVEIVGSRECHTYPWVCNNRETYTDFGKVFHEGVHVDDDIIAPWVDEPAATAPDYNNGKWHGWNGGHRPVHHESVIDVCLKTSEILTGVKGGASAMVIQYSRFLRRHPIRRTAEAA